QRGRLGLDVELRLPLRRPVHRRFRGLLLADLGARDAVGVPRSVAAGRGEAPAAVSPPLPRPSPRQNEGREPGPRPAGPPWASPLASMSFTRPSLYHPFTFSPIRSLAFSPIRSLAFS